MLFEIFLHCSLLCLFQFNWSSIMRQRTVFSLTLFISCSPNSIFGVLMILSSLCCDIISIYSVFVWFSVNLLLISHFCILSESQFNLYSISADVCPLQERLVSSANMEALVVCRQLGRSLIYKLNSKGPRFESCGTPQLIWTAFYTALFISQTCFLWCK